MILLRERLVQLLARQDIENAEYHADVGDNYLIQKISKENYQKHYTKLTFFAFLYSFLYKRFL